MRAKLPEKPTAPSGGPDEVLPRGNERPLTRTMPTMISAAGRKRSVTLHNGPNSPSVSRIAMALRPPVATTVANARSVVSSGVVALDAPTDTLTQDSCQRLS